MELVHCASMPGTTYVEVVQSTPWRLPEFVLSALRFDATVTYVTVERRMEVCEGKKGREGERDRRKKKILYSQKHAWAT